MNVQNLTPNQKTMMIAMLDSRFQSRTVDGIAGQAECPQDEVRDFFEAHPQVFVQATGNPERELWHISRRCEGPNLLALRIVLFTESGVFPIEAPGRPNAPATEFVDEPDESAIDDLEPDLEEIARNTEPEPENGPPEEENDGPPGPHD